jgi:hypothetical protein
MAEPRRFVPGPFVHALKVMRDSPSPDHNEQHLLQGDQEGQPQTPEPSAFASPVVSKDAAAAPHDPNATDDVDEGGKQIGEVFEQPEDLSPTQPLDEEASDDSDKVDLTGAGERRPRLKRTSHHDRSASCNAS